MTTTMTVSDVIRRPVEEVFAFITDARNAPQWQTKSGLQRIQQMPESPVGVGTRITEVWKFMGMESEATSEVTEYEPNKKYARVVIGSGSPIKQGTTTFESVPEGTRVTFDVTISAGGLFAIAEPLLAANMKKSFEMNIAEAKALLEGRNAA
jgi:uncharacterized protein YndB with AHSA1/START domain